jgi:hypothetical protein
VYKLICLALRDLILPEPSLIYHFLNNILPKY